MVAVTTVQTDRALGTWQMSALPVLVAQAIVVLGAVWHTPALVLAGVVLVVVLAPIAIELGRRVMVAFVCGAALLGVASMIPGFPVTGGGLALLSGVSVLLALLRASRSGWPSGLPRVDGPSWIVTLGSAAVLGILAAPLVGRGTELVLLDASRWYDNLPHFVFAKSLVEGTPLRPLYNYGYHLGIALVGGVDPTEGPGFSQMSVTTYAWMGVLLAAAAAAALGFQTLGVARALSRGGPQQRWVVLSAAVAFAVVGPLSSYVSAFHLLGHNNFLWGAAVVSVASWLALSGDTGTRGRVVLVVLGVLAAFASYRALQVGMAPAAAIVCNEVLSGRSWRSRRWRGAVSVGVGAIVFVGWVPFHYYALTHVSVLAGASVSEIGASLAIPVATVVIFLLLMVVLGLVVIRRTGSDRVVGRALAPMPGFAAFAGVMAVAVLVTGRPLDNYYIWKPASAMVVAGLPVVIALAAAATAPRRSTPSARATAALSMAAVGAFLCLLPNGTSEHRISVLPGGWAVLTERLAATSGPEEGSGLIGMAEYAGRSTANVIVFADETWGWEHRPEMATRWVEVLRGAPDEPAESNPAFWCAAPGERGSTGECLAAWLRAHPGRTLLVFDRANAVPADLDLDGVEVRQPER